ncbi:MAG TPA: DUF1772 domain-containing protein [Thermoanaerobaculia bacterium]|nr:DUF1772 domain-containing protein [Thermoanaerobaculia bacterium]
MNRTVESLLRFVNLATSGLLAGSLGFGRTALVPGWEAERPRRSESAAGHDEAASYYNAIGPIALVSAMTLAVGSKRQSRARRTFDVLSTVGLTGVLALTVLVTVPINKRLELRAPADYPNVESTSLTRHWARAQALRTALGVGAFLCAVASSLGADRK